MSDSSAGNHEGSQPAVSVIIPVRNCEQLVRDAIESILNQTFTDFELILVDDASTDNSGSILDEYERKDPRIRVMRNAKAEGAGGARNIAIQVARADLLAFNDADDTSVPERLERQKEYMDVHPELGFVASSYTVMDVDGNDLAVRRLKYEGAELAERMRHYCYIHHCAAMFRTQALRDIGGYRGGFSAAADYDMLLRLAESHKIGVFNVLVYKYRQVQSSITYANGDVHHRLADIAREFARQRAERGADDYGEYVRAGKMPQIAMVARPLSLARYYYKLSRLALDCGAYGAMLRYAWKGMLSNPIWLPRFAYVLVAAVARLGLQAVGLLDWFERTFRGR